MKNPCVKTRAGNTFPDRFKVLFGETAADFDRLNGKSKFNDHFRQILAVSFCKAIVNQDRTRYHRTPCLRPILTRGNNDPAANESG
ncbi:MULTISPECIES: hypothetical protein [Pantoea]|uniref:hypothetical protein n=1 Tax=Pantoea TaxID=53335 RepID=UPI001231DFB2|nr:MULTISPECIES: hypothetical protein [Pantoea]KAA5928293.1 hypothetical protein F3I59_13520 [Pantoea sp. VH_8]